MQARVRANRQRARRRTVQDAHRRVGRAQADVQGLGGRGKVRVSRRGGLLLLDAPRRGQPDLVEAALESDHSEPGG